MWEWDLRPPPHSVCLSGICVAQTDSLFSADAWNNITFIAGEVKEARRNIPLSLAFGTRLVIGLYLLANVAICGIAFCQNSECAR